MVTLSSMFHSIAVPGFFSVNEAQSRRIPVLGAQSSSRSNFEVCNPFVAAYLTKPRKGNR